jgi:hypothetical protein
MGAIVIRTRYDEGTELAEVATSAEIESLQRTDNSVWEIAVLFVKESLRHSKLLT